MSIENLIRQFKFGATVLNDPDPSLTPEEVIKLYEISYPFLRNATINAPSVEGGVLVYTIDKPVATTKGADPLVDALKQLDAWEAQPEQANRSLLSMNNVFKYLQTVENAPSQPINDAFLIPLA